MCVSADCSRQGEDFGELSRAAPSEPWFKLTTAFLVNRIFFEPHLKLFEKPENIGIADLGNQNLRTSPVAPQQPWKAILLFLMAIGFWCWIENFFRLSLELDADRK